MIPHIENLPIERFIWFCENLRNPEKVEVTEKLDGSVALSFGKQYPFDASQFVLSGKIWFGRSNIDKNKRFDKLSSIPVGPQWKAFKAAAEFITYVDDVMLYNYERKSLFYHGNLQTNDIIHCEILYGRRPNVIDYSINLNYVIALFRESGKDVWKIPTITGDKWIFKPLKPITNFEDFDFSEFDRRLKQIKNNPLFTSNIWIKEALLLCFVSNIKSMFGGNEIEGIILKNKETGELTKVVDNISYNGFTQKHDRYWLYMNLCHRGAKINGIWKNGVEADFRKNLSFLTELPAINSTACRSIVKKKGGITDYIEQQAGVSNEDYTRRFKILCDMTIKKLDKLYAEFFDYDVAIPSDIEDKTFDDIKRTKETFKKLKKQNNIDKSKVLELAMNNFQGG